MTYDVDYFINKFKSIPEDKWCVDEFVNKQGQCCVYGHCGLTDVEYDSPEADDLGDLFYSIGYLNPALVNNGVDPRYTQNTPKQRIMAALKDIKNGK